MYCHVDELNLTRKQKINDFTAVLHGIEAKRTQLLKQCYDNLIAPIKNLPSGGYAYIYDHYLKVVF